MNYFEISIILHEIFKYQIIKWAYKDIPLGYLEYSFNGIIPDHLHQCSTVLL